jgi:hypothetical protein
VVAGAIHHVAHDVGGDRDHDHSSGADCDDCCCCQSVGGLPSLTVADAVPRAGVIFRRLKTLSALECARELHRPPIAALQI